MMMESDRFVLKLRETALAVLKRPLTTEEENEFLSYQSASGRGDDLGDLLYMLLVCHRAAQKVETQAERLESETNVAVDRITRTLGEIVEEHEQLKREIKEQFMQTIRDATEEVMKENIENMKSEMANHAKEILDGEREFLKLRITLSSVIMLAIIAAVSYLFGSLNAAFPTGKSTGFLARTVGAVMDMRLGWWVFFVSSVWCVTWVYENWKDVKTVRAFQYKAFGFAAVAIFLLTTLFLTG